VRRIQLSDATGAPVGEWRVERPARVVLLGARVFIQHDVQANPERALSFIEVEPVRVEVGE